MKKWFEITNVAEVDSPALLFYKERIERNIQQMIDTAGDANRLYVHVKTNKTPEVVRLILAAGVTKFKCATIAEAEMVAIAGGKNVLIAHQLVGPKIQRLIALCNAYPNVTFGSLVDCVESAQWLNEQFGAANLKANVWLDLDNGMNRSGHAVDDSLFGLYEFVQQQPHLLLIGLHVYDGHLRNADFQTRKDQINGGFEVVNVFLKQINEAGYEAPAIVAGGTPTFTSHAQRAGAFCSPGTCVLWDWGYGDQLSEQHFEYAALILSRVISKPQRGIVTIDMGHKAVASENPLDRRIRFLNLENYELLSQSEEHGVLSVQNWDEIKVGEALYGVPYHVCPTVNLYEEAHLIANNEWTDTWQVLARRRKITV